MIELLHTRSRFGTFTPAMTTCSIMYPGSLQGHFHYHHQKYLSLRKASCSSWKTLKLDCIGHRAQQDCQWKYVPCTSGVTGIKRLASDKSSWSSVLEICTQVVKIPGFLSRATHMCTSTTQLGTGAAFSFTKDFRE